MSTAMKTSGSLSPSTLMTLASKSPAAIDKYVQLLSQHFKCRDLGPTRFQLGVAVEKDRSTCTLKLHQHQFILDLLEKSGMSDCKPVQSPLPPKIVLSHSMSPSTQEEKDFRHEVPYLSAVGSLQYLDCHYDQTHFPCCCLPCTLQLQSGLDQSTGKHSNIFSAMSRVLLITSLPIKVIGKQ